MITYSIGKGSLYLMSSLPAADNFPFSLPPGGHGVTRERARRQGTKFWEPESSTRMPLKREALTIAGHPHDDSGPGTLHSMVKQAGLKGVK